MGSSYLYLNNLRFHYLHWNLDHGDRPIVLLHGLASNARIWELVAPYLAEQGFRIFALDQRGHGLTDKPDSEYSFSAFRSDLLAFLDACQLENPVLVGHSWGGMVALDYAAQHVAGPRAPAGVFLVDGGLIQLDDAPGATWDQVRVRLTPPRLAGMALDDFLTRLDKWTAQLDDPETARQIIMANFEIAEDETISPRLTFERHMQIVRAMWEFKTYERLERIRCPLAAVMALPPAPHSEEEEEFVKIKQRGVSRALALHPGLYVEWMKDTIHDIPLHRPTKLAVLISEFASAALNH
jgi:pimeloyl-ACP methyl ester carboxylesterase